MAREGEVHLHAGVGAHLAGLLMEIRNMTPRWQQARGNACQSHRGTLAPRGTAGVKDRRDPALEPSYVEGPLPWTV